MKKIRVITSTISIIIAFILFQISIISKHHHHKHEFNSADAHFFAKYFDLVSVSRTLKHEKGLFYWFDWIENEAGLSTMNKTLSLLHFDAHAIEDNSDEAIHICTAPNLFVYDFFVKQALDIAYNAYFDDFNPKHNSSVTRHALRKGYIKDIVWLYPNHWLNYSQHIVMNTSYTMFRKMIYSHKYFIQPKQQKMLYLMNANNQNNTIWDKLFNEESILKPVQNAPSSLDSLEINIWVLSLNEYLNEPYFSNIDTNNIILDIDLDFFMCQEPAETFMNHFDWNQKMMKHFNNILGDHQYIPSHMFSEYSNEAIVTLLHLLNTNSAELIEMQDKTMRNTSVHKMPQIEDVFKVALEEKMDIDTIKQAIVLLFEYQIERSQHENETAQHLMHFDHVLEILHIAHRRLADIEIIGYKDSEEALHTIKRPHSNHMDHLFEIAKKKAIEEHFIHERRESRKIRKLQRNHDETFNEFEAFATKLIKIDRYKHRNLLSTEIDEFARQNQIDDDANNENIYRTEWTDHELKDLMNMTTDYLYHDYHAVLFKDNHTESWKYKYPQWVSKQMDDDTYVQHHTIHIASDDNAPYNQDRDHIKMYTNTNHTITNDEQAEFVLRFKALDPMQQHFIQRGNHSQLRSFVHALNNKQHIFLKWLIYCYYHQIKCRGRKYLPDTFNKSRHFGYDFVWHEINGWPRIIEDDEKSDALQLEIGRYHSQFTSFIDAEPNEIVFMPDTKSLERTLLLLEQVVSAKNAKIIIVGMESSPAHIPKTRRQNIECRIYKLIEHAMFNKKEHTKPCFVRLKKMDHDEIVGYPPC